VGKHTRALRQHFECVFRLHAGGIRTIYPSVSRKWIILRLKIPAGISKATTRRREGNAAVVQLFEVKGRRWYIGARSPEETVIHSEATVRERERERERGEEGREKERWNPCVFELFVRVASSTPPTDNRCCLSNWMRCLSFIFFSSFFCVVSNNRVVMQNNFRGKLPRRGKRKIMCNKMTKLLFYAFVGDCYWIAMPVVHNLWIRLTRQRKLGQIVLIKQLYEIIFY